MHDIHQQTNRHSSSRDSSTRCTRVLNFPKLIRNTCTKHNTTSLRRSFATAAAAAAILHLRWLHHASLAAWPLYKHPALGVTPAAAAAAAAASKMGVRNKQRSGTGCTSMHSINCQGMLTLQPDHAKMPAAERVETVHLLNNKHSMKSSLTYSACSSAAATSNRSILQPCHPHAYTMNTQHHCAV
jgi:hypothetical protein